MSTTEPEPHKSAPTESAPPTAPAAPRGWYKRRPLALGLLVGFAVPLAALAGYFLIAAAINRPAELTRAQYDAAVARWDKNGPASYDMDLELGGKRPGKIHIEVREGEVTHVTRDGIEPKQRRTWDYWSVPGQLDTIGQELDMAEHPAVSFGAPGAAGVAMWAVFDPRYGYPRQYDRVILGADVEVHWKVTRFQPLVPE